VRLLLDTHLLLWAAARSERLPRAARELLEDDDNEVYYSAASIWEIAIKSALGPKIFGSISPSCWPRCLRWDWSSYR
jgi:PIN domain nuclease of toxin-antitoxin system